jgi:hypothetical protein
MRLHATFVKRKEAQWWRNLYRPKLNVTIKQRGVPGLGGYSGRCNMPVRLEINKGRRSG